MRLNSLNKESLLTSLTASRLILDPIYIYIRVCVCV